MIKHLVFSGARGSGKSTISREVAHILKAGWASFGDEVKEEARATGVPINRVALQDLGARLVAKDPKAFGQRVINRAVSSQTNRAVLDGLRHEHMLPILQELLLPNEVVLVFVDVEETVRIERLKKRGGGECDLSLDEHSTEREVITRLQKIAHLRVDNSGNVEATVRALLKSGNFLL